MKYSSASVCGDVIGTAVSLPGSLPISFGLGRFSLMMRAGSASMRKSNVSCPLRSACSDRRMARNGADPSSELTCRISKRSENE